MSAIRSIRLLAAAGLAAASAAAWAQSNAPLTGAPPSAPSVPAPAASAPSSAPSATDASAAAPAAPVVRQVEASGAGAPAPAAERDPRREQFGDITRGLLGLQAGGQRAGPGLPLQGAVATAAWKRYMKSFEHEIPQWFGERVQAASGGAGMGQ